ncbi:hypothetical protein GWI33_012012 [Rhynchophorus ferrugineus]|uniref:Uncharacterized protein n=1 Tax=Rhynchophorus ferrugineus TaxID=354439 RepID=A0A834MJ38_RHYFE|nr:hypothetical protein GWI33_012012 [Rhynchophorus ferrugineus]
MGTSPRTNTSACPNGGGCHHGTGKVVKENKNNIFAGVSRQPDASPGNRPGNGIPATSAADAAANAAGELSPSRDLKPSGATARPNAIGGERTGCHDDGPPADAAPLEIHCHLEMF